MFFLIKLLLLPIWLPFKILAEVIEHSGRRRPRRRVSAGGGSGSGRKSLGIAAGVIVLLLIIGVAIGAAGNTGSTGSTSPTATGSPSASLAVKTAKTLPIIKPKTPKKKHTAAHASKAPAPSTSAPTTHAAAPATSAPPAPPSTKAAVSCYPLTNGGNCYEPGEYCRNSDHGVSGIAGDGEAIICEDNDGWRWEPA